MLKDGIQLLCDRWNELPPVRHTLLRTGLGLLGELQDWLAPLTDRFRSLAARACVWYADVRQATDGPVPAANPALDRICQALSGGGAPDHNDQNPEPPFDNRTLAAAMVGLGDQFNAMHGLLIKMGGEVSDLGQRMDSMGRAVSGLGRRMDRIGGEVFNLKGQRMENLAIRSIEGWTIDFSQTREPPLAEPDIELMWTDRQPDRESNEQWRDLCIRLGLPETGRTVLRRCDFLIRAEWPGEGDRDRGRKVVFFVGEASTTLSQKRQQKLITHCDTLGRAGNIDHNISTVVPVLFGLEHRTVVDLPHLVDVRIERQQFEQPDHDQDWEDYRTVDELNAILEPLLAQG